MKQVIKSADSEVIKQQLLYKDGKNNLLRQLLANEQHSLCAYTETYLGATDDAHIEHFNPNLKGQPADGYYNWFLVKSLWNTQKAKKWLVPILHPTAQDLESRILYIDGDYVAANLNDIEAVNLIKLLGLDNAKLADQRKRYVRLKKREVLDSGKQEQQYFNDLLINYSEGVYFIRAIEEEFQVRVNFDLLKAQ